MKNSVTENNQLPYLGIRYLTNYNKCNIDCPYCIADWKKKNYIFDTNKFKKILSSIKNLPHRVCLRLGAPGDFFTSPEILQIIGNLCNEDNNIYGVSFSTNLQFSLEEVIKPFIRATNIHKLSIGCTLHDTVIKDIDSFFEKIRWLKENGVLLYVGYVALPNRIQFIKEYKKRCEQIGVPLILNALIGELRDEEKRNSKLMFPRDYSGEEKNDLKKLWHSPHSYKLLVEACNTRGMHCSAGKNYVFINSDGNVFPCGQIKSSIGNMLDGNIYLREKDMICPRDVCWCGNENQALRIVDKYYDRTRALRIYYPKQNILEQQLYEGYKPSVYKFGPAYLLKKIKDILYYCIRKILNLFQSR